MISLKTPLGDEIKELKAGQRVELSGEIFTARDRAHARIVEIIGEGKELPINLEGAVVYHCGPLVKNGNLISAGPTTSMRMDAYTPFILSKGVKAVIGKGGVSEGTVKAIGDNGCIYLAFPGGCGALAAQKLRIKEVFWLELGEPEALWLLEADKLGPLVVAVDASGESLYKRSD